MKLFQRVVGTTVLFAISIASALAAEFGQADLEKVVTELTAVIPQNENYLYPVKSQLVDKNELNAYATLRKEEGQKKPRAVMVVFTGLVKAANGDARLIRAVVAHELSHLSLGHHLDIDPAARDVKNLWIRQQEFEADMAGAIALQRAGFSKQDMADMLMFLAKTDGRKGDWLLRMTSDHADPKARAAEISNNPKVLKALVTFDVGLAYFDNRNFRMARDMFDYAALQEPNLLEAYVNSAKSSLMFYYDNLGAAVRDQMWWRPDFGPMLTDVGIGGAKDPQIRQEDVERWQAAMQKVAAAMTKAPNMIEPKEMMALGQVLDPTNDKTNIQKGVDWFKSAMSTAKDPAVKLRYANNAGVGMHRLGNVQGAFDLMLSAQKGTDNFNPAVGENLGRVTINNPSQDTAKLAASVVYTWLSDTPPSSPNWSTVKKSFDDLIKKGGFKDMEIKQKPTYLCRVMSLTTSGKELGLLVPESTYFDALGKADIRITFTDRFPDLAEIRWKGGNIAVFTERGDIMRVTSYEDGSFLTLKPIDTTLQNTFKIAVGMTEADLAKILNPKAGVKKELARGGKTEEWTYYQALNFGVLMKDGKVSGLTVTPVIYEN